MAYDLPFLDNHTQHKLNRQIASLARDAGHISDALGRFAAQAQRDAGRHAHDLIDETWEHGTAAARVVGEQAMRAGKAVSKDPVPAVVAVAGLACLVSLVLASSRVASRRH